MGQPAFLRHDLMFNIGISTINNNAHIANLGLKVSIVYRSDPFISNLSMYFLKVKETGVGWRSLCLETQQHPQTEIGSSKRRNAKRLSQQHGQAMGPALIFILVRPNILSTSVRPKHRGASTKGQDQYICICRGKDTSLRTLMCISWTGIDRWFERCAKEAIISQWRTLSKERRRSPSPSPPFSHLPGGLSQDD